MNTITKITIFLLFSLYLTNAVAQENDELEATPEEIEALRENIRAYEKEALKIEVESINKRVSDKDITYEQGENLKQEVAKKRALNIENRIDILEKRIAFNKRNNLPFPYSKRVKDQRKVSISFGDNDANLAGLKISDSESKPVKYDIRTSNDMVFAIGFNNAIIDGVSLSDSPYKLGGSGFVELGWNWKTRLAKNSNFARLKYGFSFQFNKYNLKDNQYFTQEGSNTKIDTFGIDAKKIKFRTTNLVVPIYFEFGPYTKVEKKDRVRFHTWDKFKIGIGGYAGVNIGSRQKIKYEEDDDNVKVKQNGNFDVNPFIYGVGAYIGFGDLSLYAKYDLSETFKNDALKQNNISLGLRVDLD